MKKNKIIYPIIASLMLVFSACEPIVDEEHLSNSTNVEGVSLVATQSTPGGNEITIEMETPGITGYWSNINIGQKRTNKVKFVYPVPGKATFTYTGTLGAEFFTKTVDVQIDVLDHPLEQDYYDLVGEDTNAGKTWVFAGQPGSGVLYWFMSPADNPDTAMTAWWNAGDSADNAPSDVKGKMHFDLNNNPNFTHYETASATGTKGGFNLNIANKTLTVYGGAEILGGAKAGDGTGVYKIVSLTEDEMVLWVNKGKMNAGTGWTFVFKPQ